MTASSALEQLAELQELDRVLQEKEREVDALRAELSGWEARLAERRQEAESLAARTADVDRRRRELEARLAVEEDKMKERRMRLNRIRNERELRALQHEIELAKTANQQMENEVIQLMEELEQLQAALVVAREQQEALEQEFQQQASTREDAVVRLRAEMEEARQKRAELAAKIDPQLLQRYEQIRARRGGLAVAEVRAAICLGCNMNLPPQFYNELLRGDEIRLCPNCHRILIWRANDAGAGSD